jgi:hypothetical protein
MFIHTPNNNTNMITDLLQQLFHRVSFRQADPLGGGLREEIEAEQLEPEAITLDDGINEGQLETFWQNVEQDIERDPEWFRFTDE